MDMNELLEDYGCLTFSDDVMKEMCIRDRFRGSNNQRVIDMKKTREQNQIVLWDEK